MSKTYQVVVNDELQEIIKRIGKEIVLSDNVSQIIRYAIYVAADKLKD